MMQLKKRDLEQVAGAANIGQVIIHEGGIVNIVVIIPPGAITSKDDDIAPKV